jgi:signal transduction histidine kinase
MESGDLHQILEGAVSILWPQIRQKAELRREYADLPPVPCYPAQLGQAFLNLIHNAVQAIERRGVIQVRTMVRPGGVVVEVQDDGCGMPPEVAGRIFESFFTTKPRGIGTGLGLKITKRIVDRHGGTLSVRTAPGQGSTFRVELPIGSDPRGAKSPGGPA